jgi:hypothetical protein
MTNLLIQLELNLKGPRVAPRALRAVVSGPVTRMAVGGLGDASSIDRSQIYLEQGLVLLALLLILFSQTTISRRILGSKPLLLAS